MNIELVAIKALQLILSLSLLVVLHEGGHYGFSKLFGVKVEKFYMFFDYKFHLFSTRMKWFTRLFPHFKDNETEYGIGWIPLGGYVKIAGMVDESMDTEQMKQPAQANEFRSQAVWKRLLIMLGGVMMNLITAFAIYSAILFVWGKEELPMQNITEGFAFNQEAEQMGFRDGDIPVAIDGEQIDVWSVNVLRGISRASEVTVLRDGKQVVLAISEDNRVGLAKMGNMNPPFITYLNPSIIDSVIPGPAQQAGIKAGSRILAVDGRQITSWNEYDEQMLRRQDILAAAGCTRADSLQQRKMNLVVLAPTATVADTISLTLDEKLLMGAVRHNVLVDYKTETHEYGALSCIPAGVVYTWDILSGYVSDLREVFTRDGAQSVGSFISIGSIFPAAWDWMRFWSLTALLSVILAVMNVLPIPGLDGGHVVLLLYEAVTGKAPSDKVMEWIERIGLGIIIGLMFLAMGNDIIRWIVPLFQ